MPTVKSKEVLAKSYAAAALLIRKRQIPTDVIFPDRTFFRLIDPTRPYSRLTKPAAGGHASKYESFNLLIPADGHKSPEAAEDTDDVRNRNRFSGISHNLKIAPSAALYLSAQQQALMNEAMHYNGSEPLDGRCILRFRVLGSMLVADLSPHNPGARRFFDSLGKHTWKEVNDPEDCSVARGIGLAIAHSGFLSGLQVQTVRSSERSNEERGDNLLLFTAPGRPVPRITIEAVTYYEKGRPPQTFPVEFP